MAKIMTYKTVFYEMINSDWLLRLDVFEEWDTSNNPIYPSITVDTYVQYTKSGYGYIDGLLTMVTVNNVSISELTTKRITSYNKQWVKVCTLTPPNVAENFTSENIHIKVSLSNPVTFSVNRVIPLIEPVYEKDFSEEDKYALEHNTAAIKVKLIVKATDTLPEIVLTDDNSIKSLEYTDERLVPQQGFIGQFVARTLSGELQNISNDFNIEGREIEFLLGVVKLDTRYSYLSEENEDYIVTEEIQRIELNDTGENETSWYSYGTFIVTDPEDDEVKDNTKFEAMDYTKKFNIPFDGEYTDAEYMNSYTFLTSPSEDNSTNKTVSALWLAKYTCKQAGVQLFTDDFVNNDFEIDINPFKAGETCRDVMKEIGKLAFSWVRVGRDDMCHIDFTVQSSEHIDTYNTLDNNQYFELSTKPIVYGPINNVGIGMSAVDGETITKPQDGTDGDNIIYIYDNPLLYSDELREKAIAKADVLYGLTYTQLDVETIGHPWFTGTELLNIKDMENNNNYIYPFNKVLKYSGHIRSEISSMGDSEVEDTLGYTSDIIRDLIDAQIQVNKNTGDISAYSKRLTSVETDMGEVYTKEEADHLFITAETGLTNIFSNVGGNNNFKNSALWFKEGDTFAYWEGPANVTSEPYAISQTAILLQNGNLKQTISGIPNGPYTISFKYEKLSESSSVTASVYIDSVEYNLGNNGEFIQTIQTTTNTIDFILTCNNNNGYKVYDLMCNLGKEKTTWSQYANETKTDTVNISDGIKITSTKTSAVFKADADGIRIENTSQDQNYTTNFLDKGMSTYNAEIRGQAQISGSLFTRVSNQTWINGL